MKIVVLVPIALLAGGLTWAQELGQVISSTPVLQQVAVPRQVCDRIEGAPQTQAPNLERCTTQTFYTNRAVAYNVVYEYAGKQYSVQMPDDPGPTIQLQVTPVGMSQALPSAPLYVQPSYGVMVPPVYSGYYNRPYYPPAVLELNYRYRYRDGYRGRHR